MEERNRKTLGDAQTHKIRGDARQKKPYMLSFVEGDAREENYRRRRQRNRGGGREVRYRLKGKYEGWRARWKDLLFLSRVAPTGGTVEGGACGKRRCRRKGELWARKFGGRGEMKGKGMVMFK
ncbi:unnamed protein product [Linum trigynum]|uniref:Uncharacterized protein n=1 Tax=Linum trigynum TaxID=586398 RepID=A0AAV2GS05_9ROSI